jgi:hypothetical protein
VKAQASAFEIDDTERCRTKEQTQGISATVKILVRAAIEKCKYLYYKPNGDWGEDIG